VSQLDTNAQFKPILEIIQKTRSRVESLINHELIDLYWNIGAYLIQKTELEGWGKSTVQQLADWLLQQQPELKGFSSQNLWRMRQFHQFYTREQVLSPLVREIPWSHHLLVMGKCNTPEERQFYLTMTRQERWTKRELERQINSALFERSLTNPVQASSALHTTHPNAAHSLFKDTYMLEFLGLPAQHSEADLQHGLVSNLKRFLLELGTGFTFVGESYRVQVGTQDFFIDLLLYHRGLQALVAFELKIDDFKPAYMGQLEFYLEALDRDHRQPHEAPSIGVLLCKSADAEVVEYALARSTSPALVAKYMTQLPDKALLQAKLEEFYVLAQREVVQS
jgi:predicted nuclease of restriction endonuclease-like (RecB) superfamily